MYDLRHSPRDSMYDAVWESIFSSRGWGRYPAEDLVRFVAREAFGVADRGRLKALELGCGPGANLWFLARERIPFDAIDGSPTAVSQATARLDEELPGWRGRIRCGDFCALPEDFTGYDFVIDSEAICCNDLAESRRLIEQVHDRLLPGGAFWSRTFAPGTWGTEDGERVGDDYWRFASGPLAAKGAIRLTPRDSIPALYGSRWESLRVGEITRHDGDPREQIREWIIVARKAASLPAPGR
ncbi:class I SAM-dependent methyltransferase [Caenimonas terrae]|uniref:Class I SAM-dependent methyltransferase n=1 Tax=Caenimonas terrae TaxID=696074 RepID=A0ABW0N9J6_9BURK